MIITIDNFFIQSKGRFKELTEIPEGFTKFFDSITSVYYTDENKTQLVRVSDHWGSMIRKCTWFLLGHPFISCRDWNKTVDSEMRIGIVEFTSLKLI